MQEFVLLPSIMGRVPKVPFHSCLKPHQVPFLKQKLGVDFWDTPWRAK